MDDILQSLKEAAGSEPVKVTLTSGPRVDLKCRLWGDFRSITQENIDEIVTSLSSRELNLEEFSQPYRTCYDSDTILEMFDHEVAVHEGLIEELKTVNPNQFKPITASAYKVFLKDCDLQRLKTVVQDTEYIAFIGETEYEFPSNVETIEKNTAYLIKGQKSSNIVRLMNTNGNDYSISCERIARAIEKWDREYGIKIYKATHDVLEFELKQLPKELTDFVKELRKLSPEYLSLNEFQLYREVHFDSRKLNELKDKQNIRFHLWWDS